MKTEAISIEIVPVCEGGVAFDSVGCEVSKLKIDFTLICASIFLSNLSLTPSKRIFQLYSYFVIALANHKKMQQKTEKKLKLSVNNSSLLCVFTTSANQIDIWYETRE